MSARLSLSRVSGSAAIGLALMVLECSGPSEPVVATFRSHVADGPQTFVLSAVEEQRGEWIITHQCESTGTQYRVREQFDLSPDGSARRDSWSEHLVNGVVTDSGHVYSTGRWEIPSGANLVFTLMLPNGPEFRISAKIRSSTTFSLRGPMGGVCPDAPENGRVVDYFFSMP